MAVGGAYEVVLVRSKKRHKRNHAHLARWTDCERRLGMSPPPVKAHDVAAVAREPLAQPVGQQLRRRVPARERRGDDRALQVAHRGGRAVPGGRVSRRFPRAYGCLGRRVAPRWRVTL